MLFSKFDNFFIVRWCFCHRKSAYIARTKAAIAKSSTGRRGVLRHNSERKYNFRECNLLILYRNHVVNLIIQYTPTKHAISQTKNRQFVTRKQPFSVRKTGCKFCHRNQKPPSYLCNKSNLEL